MREEDALSLAKQAIEKELNTNWRQLFNNACEMLEKVLHESGVDTTSKPAIREHCNKLYIYDLEIDEEIVLKVWQHADFPDDYDWSNAGD